jgi:non-heme chloroperoxidase
MDTYADDPFEVVKKLSLKDAVHIGHSTGGGEVTRYVARHGKGRVKKAVLISAIPPLFMKTAKSPDGVPKEVVDSIRDGTANHRSQFYQDITMPHAWRGRPDLSVSNHRREVCQTVEARNTQVLSGPAARMPTTHADQIKTDLLAFIRS